jgi:hypothetical protein
LAVAVVLVALTRGRLCYRNYQQEEDPVWLQPQHEDEFPRKRNAGSSVSEKTT